MLILNFAHPLTPAQLSTIEALTGQAVEQVVDVKAQFDNAEPFEGQVEALIARAPLSQQEWQTAPLLVNLPGLSPAAALLLAQLHGRMGYFPAIVRLRPLPGAAPVQFEVAEILNLQTVRDTARARR